MSTQDKDIVRDWRFVRSETAEILSALNDETLVFKPEGDRWQPVYYQFACMARTQMVYTRALSEGKMDFAYFGDPMLPDKHVLRTKADLQKWLNDADKAWQEAMQKGKKEVKWPGVTITAASHASRLMGHERIHHGLLIAYFTLGGWDLPPNFKQNWAL